MDLLRATRVFGVRLRHAAGFVHQIGLYGLLYKRLKLYILHLHIELKNGDAKENCTVFTAVVVAVGLESDGNSGCYVAGGRAE